MIYAILGVLLLIAVYAPSAWVRIIMVKYADEDHSILGTGAQFASHLIRQFDLQNTRVEETRPQFDHFDPQANCVRLSPANYHGKSITAIAVAAHEVGHAIQFNRNEPISRLRGRYIPKAVLIKKLGIAAMMAIPIITAVFRVPHAAFITAGIGILTMLVSAVMYLIVLPEEWDASFNKALPILEKGNYINQTQHKAAKKVLRAAALTYFAGALADILSIWRWLIILRR